MVKRRECALSTVIKRDERSSEGICYEYELSVSESRRLSSYRIPLYSVRVMMTNKNGERTSARADDAFADAGRAIIFYEKLVANLATPIDLAYILEDEG